MPRDRTNWICYQLMSCWKLPDRPDPLQVLARCSAQTACPELTQTARQNERVADFQYSFTADKFMQRRTKFWISAEHQPSSITGARLLFNQQLPDVQGSVSVSKCAEGNVIVYSRF